MVSCTSDTLTNFDIIFITSVDFCMWPVTFCCAIWFSICITTEFIVAFDVCSLLTALRERTTSLASIFAVPTSPRFAASLTDFLVFVSARSISARAAKAKGVGGEERGR